MIKNTTMVSITHNGPFVNSTSILPCYNITVRSIAIPTTNIDLKDIKMDKEDEKYMCNKNKLEKY